MEGLAVKSSPAKGNPRPNVLDYSKDNAAVSKSSSEQAIKIEGLSFAHPKSDHYLFKSMNLSISQGEAISLLGPSGCGKSSLLHLIAGLAFPSSGSISVNGEKVLGPSSRVNLMLQKATLYPWLNVVQNACFGLRAQKASKQEALREVRPLLKMVKLEDFERRNVRRLSGGQQQRVALARSLAIKPSVMLLDEPFSALDTFTRIELQTEVRDICKRENITLVIVTHDFDEAIRMSDRIFMMTNNVGADIVSEIDNKDTFNSSSLDEAIAAKRSKLTALWHKHMAPTAVM